MGIDTNKCSYYHTAMSPAREFVEIEVKSVLNKVTGMPFRWSINPYRGCSHGCVFCYARRTHWFLDEDGIDGWASKIFVKANAPEVLRQELSRASWKRENVALGTATDPYQAIEGRYRLTRRILEALRDFRTPVSIVTRSAMVLRDLDVLTALAKCAGVTVCVSIATTDPRLAHQIEPTVAPPEQRLRTVETLSAAGIRAGVLLAPILPGLTDDPKSLAAVVEAARDHNAHFLGHNVLHLGEVTKDAFIRYLREYHPNLIPRYQLMYKAKYAPGDYRKTISRIVDREEARYQIPERRYLEPPKEAEQLSLLLPGRQPVGAASSDAPN
jgi:DNA repair photolyase